MSSLMLFLHIIAWVVAVVGTVVGGLTLYVAMNYEGSMTELQDKLSHQKRTFYHWRFLTAAFIAWAFIIAF
jgi:hypothetical protein